MATEASVGEDEGDPTVRNSQMELDSEPVDGSEASMDEGLLNSPTKTITNSPTRSETDSVDQSLGKNFASMGYTPEMWEEFLKAYPALPTKSPQKE